jgi:hypothetical protein
MNFQTNVVLSQSAADWLDTQALAIRKGQHAYSSRSAFVRALVHGIEDAGLDFSAAESNRRVDPSRLAAAMSFGSREAFGSVSIGSWRFVFGIRP